MNMCVYRVFKCAPLFAFHKRGPCVFTVPAPWISDPLGSAPSTVACGVRLFKRLPENFLNSGGAIARQGAPSPNLAVVLCWAAPSAQPLDTAPETAAPTPCGVCITT